ncbi:hypothetical protein VNO77_17198 [Canavalia gladiata]|uniref:DC1 domain-containing protein n=1 Tax=Canavalia gladiata TaxID=3824 RepID=A0AAN9LMB0_CANGL
MGSVHKDPNVLHFSHPHPLECTTSSSSTGKNAISCFGCKLKVKHGEEYYQCKTCAFSLHHVCYKIPLITNHPSHPTHDLVLVIPSSPATKSKTTFSCMACGNHVKGFCYHCAECGIFFHSLCLALPLSLTITYHPHKINLEFSPPYDFFCDLCNKPSYRGWLYRCNMCEFDTHVACAIENIEPHFLHNPSFPQSSPLLRQLTSHQEQVDHKRDSRSIGDGSTWYDYEIMSLMAQQIGGGIIKSTSLEDFNSGWHKRLYSPRKKHNRNSTTESGKMKIVELELQETDLSPADSLANLEERTPLRDKFIPLSDHSSPPLSNQYSESCFSIDLTKSYSTHERRNQLRREGTSDQIVIQGVIPERVVSNSRPIEEPFGIVNWPSNDAYNMTQQNKLKTAFFNEGSASDFLESSQKVMTKNPNQGFVKRPIKDQKITKSESVSSIKLVPFIFSTSNLHILVSG